MSLVLQQAQAWYLNGFASEPVDLLLPSAHQPLAQQASCRVDVSVAGLAAHLSLCLQVPLYLALWAEALPRRQAWLRCLPLLPVWPQQQVWSEALGQVFGPWCSTHDANFATAVVAAQVVVALLLAAPPSPDADQRLARLHLPLWGQ